MEERISKQSRVAKEIVDTEVTYVDKLHILYLLFYQRAIVLRKMGMEVRFY